jgi:hypothetical protein
MWVAETEKNEIDKKSKLNLQYGEIKRIDGCSYYQVSNPDSLWHSVGFLTPAAAAPAVPTNVTIVSGPQEQPTFLKASWQKTKGLWPALRALY